MQTTEDGFNGVTYEEDTKLKVFWWYHFVGLIWTSEFILACQQMVISGSVALWYFTRWVVQKHPRPLVNRNFGGLTLPCLSLVCRNTFTWSQLYYTSWQIFIRFYSVIIRLLNTKNICISCIGYWLTSAVCSVTILERLCLVNDCDRFISCNSRSFMFEACFEIHR